MEIKGSVADGMQRGSDVRFTAVCDLCVPHPVSFDTGLF